METEKKIAQEYEEYVKLARASAEQDDQELVKRGWSKKEIANKDNYGHHLIHMIEMFSEKYGGGMEYINAWKALKIAIESTNNPAVTSVMIPMMTEIERQFEVGEFGEFSKQAQAIVK